MIGVADSATPEQSAACGQFQGGVMSRGSIGANNKLRVGNGCNQFLCNTSAKYLTQWLGRRGSLSVNLCCAHLMRELQVLPRMCFKPVSRSRFRVLSQIQAFKSLSGSRSCPVRGGTKIQVCTSPQPPVLASSNWKHNGHWIRQRVIETHFSTCSVRHCAFHALASALKPSREVILKGKWHGWQAGPSAVIVMMNLPAGSGR